MQIDNYIIGTLAFNQEPLLIWSCQFFHHLVPPLPKLHRSHNVPPTVASVWTASAAWTASASARARVGASVSAVVGALGEHKQQGVSVLEDGMLVDLEVSPSLKRTELGASQQRRCMD